MVVGFFVSDMQKQAAAETLISIQKSENDKKGCERFAKEHA